ncbi:hypothetical protein ES705_09744 [subsurface metagenome]
MSLQKFVSKNKGICNSINISLILGGVALLANNRPQLIGWILIGLGVIIIIIRVLYRIKRRSIDFKELKEFLMELEELYCPSPFNKVFKEKISEKLRNPTHKRIHAFFMIWASDYDNFNMVQLAYLLILRKLEDIGCKTCVYKRIPYPAGSVTKKFLGCIVEKIAPGTNVEVISERKFQIVEELIEFIDEHLASVVTRKDEVFDLHKKEILMTFVRNYTFILTMQKLLKFENDNFYILLEFFDYKALTGLLIKKKCKSFCSVYLKFNLPKRSCWLTLGLNRKEIESKITSWGERTLDTYMFFLENIFLPLCIFDETFCHMVNNKDIGIKYLSNERKLKITFKSGKEVRIVNPSLTLNGNTSDDGKRRKEVKEIKKKRNNAKKVIESNMSQIKEIISNSWVLVDELLSKFKSKSGK